MQTSYQAIYRILFQTLSFTLLFVGSKVPNKMERLLPQGEERSSYMHKCGVDSIIVWPRFLPINVQQTIIAAAIYETWCAENSPNRTRCYTRVPQRWQHKKIYKDPFVHGMPEGMLPENKIHLICWISREFALPVPTDRDNGDLLWGVITGMTRITSV